MGTAVPHSTVLIDLDGVLRTWPTDYSKLEAAHGLPAESIPRTAFESELLEQVITGQITDHDWRDEVANRLASANPTSRAKEAVAAWSEPVGEVNREVLCLIIEARRTCRIGLITNATDRLQIDLAALGLPEHLDFIVNSSEVGFAKPSSEIFKYALSVAGTRPEEAVFIDDTLSNITVASAMGITAHHFGSARDLRAFMKSTGLLPNEA
jgi:putative hydrolase of the HAD superfamily